MNKKEKRFVQTVLDYYGRHGRRNLPWRRTKNPYKILVSEMMLQQTQVDRVIPKYQMFVKQFPTIHDLAHASLKEVLIAWQGLGYNRRAKMLHSCAQQLVAQYAPKFPRTKEELMTLPGIGSYTASAILAFAFNIKTTFVETNIRSVYLHHFFKNSSDVTDEQLLKIIERTLPEKDVRTWYWGLMDYGSYVKKEFGNPNYKSRHHTVQATFKGSDRQIRGILIWLLSEHSYTRKNLHAQLSSFEEIRVDAMVEKLLNEGMIVRKGKHFLLP